VEQAGAGCCGALRQHLDDHDGARNDARRNIDAWWPAVARGEIEAIVMTASGCGVQVRDYGHLLADDAAYAEKAARISGLTRDIGEVVADERDVLVQVLAKRGSAGRLAFHAPCTLQHGQQIRGVIESILTAAGFELVPVRDGHLCCGSAGTYSLLQPELSHKLRDNKLAALTEHGAPAIASANIGCLTHLEPASSVPVRHWIEYVDERLRA